MKEYFSTAVGIVCVVLIASLILVKRNDNAQHTADTTTIVTFSNQLASAQDVIAIRDGTILMISNKLDASVSESTDFSNRWMQAESAFTLAAEQVTNLNRRVAVAESENMTLNRRVVDLTNQAAEFSKQMALTEASLAEANSQNALLGKRLREDMAERVVVERKFNNPLELQAQMEKLKQNPAGEISAESIYAGLDVEVKSNGVIRVLSTD